MTATAVHTAADGPLFLFAGRAFLTCDCEALRDALLALKSSGQLPTWFQTAEWERALAISSVQMERESVRLFYHPAGAPCAPWQSVHSDEGVLMGRTHHDAMAWFRQAGLEPRTDTEPADHIGLLLTFYGRLLVEADVDPEQIEQFREQHLLWLRSFCSRLHEASRLEFFRLLSDLVGMLLHSEPGI